MQEPELTFNNNQQMSNNNFNISITTGSLKDKQDSNKNKLAAKNSKKQMEMSQELSLDFTTHKDYPNSP